jgi:hypothetical protein
MRDISLDGEELLSPPLGLRCFFRSTRKSSAQLSSRRDLRFLSDFPREICIMYITARPFRKWETYLDSPAAVARR